MNKETVRAAHGVPKAKDAFDTLLDEPDVMARSNKNRRFQYLMAKSSAE